MPSGYDQIGEKQSGDPNIMKLKEVNKVRPLDNVVAGWRQHSIEHPSDPEQFAAVVCPGPRSCPLCRKPVDAKGHPRFQVSRRYAANVWDYDTSKVKVLVAGPQVFDEFKAAATVGIMPDTCDWTITKSGTKKQTEYKVIRHDTGQSGTVTVQPEQLISVDKYEQPTSTETIFEILERFGINYDALEVPSYTLDQALAFVMPYGKHKGLTIEELLASEADYAQYIHSSKLEQGSLGDPVFVALQTALEAQELVPPLDEALASIPEPEVSQTPAPATALATETQAPSSQVSPASASMVKLIGTDGKEVVVPPSVVDSMLSAGFKRPEPPKPQLASDANALMKVLINGNEVTLAREQALMLIAAGSAQEFKEPVKEPEPKLPLPDEQVQVNIGGAVVPMIYVQAAQVVDNPASNAHFEDANIQKAHERVKAGEQANKAAAANPTSPGSPASTTGSGSSTEVPTTGQATQASGTPSSSASVPGDPEKPFICDECQPVGRVRFKTKGALTQHQNREHKAAVPQPSSVPSVSNGSLEQEVKSLLQRSPLMGDYQQILDMFAEVTGKSNFSDMDQDDLKKLKDRLELIMAGQS